MKNPSYLESTARCGCGDQRGLVLKNPTLPLLSKVVASVCPFRRGSLKMVRFIFVSTCVPQFTVESITGAGELVRIRGWLRAPQYINILENHLLPQARAHFDQRPWRFVQDRSPIHTSHAVTNWLQQNVNTLPWPSRAADLNPIENVWADMVRMMGDQLDVASEDELWVRIQQTWNELQRRPNYFRNLIQSMRRRIQAVYRLHGFWSKY